jgi:hypothetical protein
MCSWRRVAVARVFAPRGAMQDYAVITLFSRWQKPCLTGVSQAGVTPGGSPRREPGRPAPPLTVYHFDQKILAVQKPIAYTDLLAIVILSS